MRYDYMICPAKSLGISAWSGMTCDPNPVFKWREAVVPVQVNEAIKSAVRFLLSSLDIARVTSTACQACAHFAKC